jgi:predicted alpha/beta-fold hydrolase
MPGPAEVWELPAYRPLGGGGDLLTVLAAVWPRRSGLPPAEDTVIEVAPEARLLVRCHWQSEPETRPAVVLVHGLEGSSESGYLLGTAALAWQAGFSVARMNLRGCGDGFALSVTPYHSGLSGDVAAVVQAVAAQAAAVYVAGFSLGANLTLKMAAELGTAAPEKLRAVAGISPALDLAACVRALERPRNRLYQAYFVTSLKRSFRRRQRLFPERYGGFSVRGVRTVRAFDEAFTAPLFGFASADDYYRRASALPWLEGLARPALLVAAADDPLVPVETLAYEAVRQHRWVRLLVTPAGGHCAFLAAGGNGHRFWAEAAVVEFFRRQWEQATGG